MADETGLPDGLNDSVIEMLHDTCKVSKYGVDGINYVIFRCEQYAKGYDLDADIKCLDIAAVCADLDDKMIQNASAWIMIHFTSVYTPGTDTVWLIGTDDNNIRNMQARRRGVPMSLWIQYTMLTALGFGVFTCRVCMIDGQFIVVPYMHLDVVQQRDTEYVRVMHMQMNAPLSGLLYLMLCMMKYEHVRTILPWSILGDTVIEQAFVFKTNARMRYAFIMCFLTDGWKCVPTGMQIASAYTEAFEHVFQYATMTDDVSMYDFAVSVCTILFSPGEDVPDVTASQCD